MTNHPNGVEIAKSDGTKRSLGIPIIRDRIVQMAAKIVLEPIFEADFLPSSFGHRPKREATDAMERIRTLAKQGYNYVLDADIENYFGSIDNRWPSKESLKRIKAKIHSLTHYKQWVKNVRQLAIKLNPVLRGWANYFRMGNSSKKFQEISWYLWERLMLFENRRKHKKRPHASRGG